jgi:hypothetical protein
MFGSMGSYFWYSSLSVDAFIVCQECLCLSNSPIMVITETGRVLYVEEPECTFQGNSITLYELVPELGTGSGTRHWN